MTNIRVLEGLIPYPDALELMFKTHKQRTIGVTTDTFYILEHEPVFTLGNHGGLDNIIKPLDFLSKKGISVIETTRGGNITYHGPGQVVVYPVINIKKLKIGIKEYIYRLEEITILTLKYCGIEALRDVRNNGVWVNGKKIASVGVRVKDGITLHGVAININTDLIPFTWINPCGLVGIEATSALKVLHKTLDISEVKTVLISNIKHVFKESVFEN